MCCRIYLTSTPVELWLSEQMPRNEPGAVRSGISRGWVNLAGGPAFRSNTRAWILSSPADNLYPMSEARDVATDSELSQAHLAWLDARLEEYRDLLQYLRDH